MQSIVRSERGWSHRLIEEFMLSANECVATWIEQNGIPGIYRIHEMPDPKRIVEFEETASAFGYSLGLQNLPVKQMVMRADRRDARRNGGRDSGRGGGGQGRKPQTHEVPEQIPVSPQMYQKLTEKIAGKPEERILSYLMLRSLKQAKYSEKNEGHFALASPCYTHFTSPIRRYPDLIVHRLVRALLESGADARGGEILSTDPQPWRDAVERGVHGPGRRRARKAMDGVVDAREGSGRYEWEPIAESELGAIAVESSQAERRADDAERELMEWKKMRFMEDRIGEDFSGIILSCTKYGFFVELDELFIEGLVPISTLGDWGSDERFVFRETDRQIVSTRTGKGFKIGQRVRVLLDRIDRQNRRLQFALVREPAAKPSTKASVPEPQDGARPYQPRSKRGKRRGAAEGERSAETGKAKRERGRRKGKRR
jgi:ribonuclease R